MTTNEQPQHRYGEHYRVDSMEAAREAVQSLLDQARYQVDILSPHLDPQLYDQGPALEALRRVVVDGRHRARIRILVADPEQITQRGHRLVNLARQLSTYMDIRKLGEDDITDPPCWLIVDRQSHARWEAGTGYDGIVGPGCRAESVRLERAFSERWSRSVADPSLRRLHI